MASEGFDSRREETNGVLGGTRALPGILWVHEVSRHLAEARVGLPLYSLFSRSKCNTIWSLFDGAMVQEREATALAGVPTLGQGGP